MNTTAMSQNLVESLARKVEVIRIKQNGNKSERGCLASPDSVGKETVSAGPSLQTTISSEGKQVKKRDL